MPTKRLILFLSLLVPYLSLSAQGFCVEGVFSSPCRGTAQLTLYEGGRNPRILRAHVHKGKCVFEGKVAHPVVASLWHNNMGRQLFFYIENSTIRITVNEQQPERSHISGSRSNSEYRVVAEQWDDHPDYTSAYAPLVLLHRDGGVDLLSDFDSLRGDAACGWQYELLRQRVAHIRSSQVGSKLPCFEFVDTTRHKVSTDTLFCDSLCHVFLFGASYCSQCNQAQKQLQQLSRGGSLWDMVVCRLDDDPRGWDADWVDSLAIDHIPYIILVAADGTILERDLRVWEVERILNNTQ